MMTDELTGRLAKALGSAYALGPEIGRGGMGVVYRATDTRLRRDVAIKVLPPDLSYRRELRERFVREAQLAGGLNHPNIVPIYDVGEGEGLVWYVMAFVEGESVRMRVEREGPFTAAQTRRIIREVAWALGYAHARGIIHRDIKPDNILLERGTGRAIVTDFGIAKIVESDTAAGGAPATAPGLILGSLMYMAPEQAIGEGEIDGRIDIYALGLTGYSMLAGHPPFDKPTVFTVATRIARGVTPDWEAIEQPLEPTLRSLLEKCVSADPDGRWQSAEAILEALGPQAIAPRPMPPSIRRLVRDSMLVPTLGLIVLVTDIVTDNPSLGEFIGWLALILMVNFGITLRAFERRGFGWPDLRDALEMEFARQAEELEVTGALKDRFSAVVYLATFAGLAVSFVKGALILGLEPVLPIAAAMVLAGAVAAAPLAWIQVKIYTFFGRLLLKLLPSLPRPEGERRFSRFADKLLTRLFRPLGAATADLEALPATASSWSASEVGAARRSTRSIDHVFEELPLELQQAAQPARRVARELTLAIDEIRRERGELERTRDRDIEALNATSHNVSLALKRLRDTVQDLSSGGGPTDELETALAQAAKILRRTSEYRPAERLAARRGGAMAASDTADIARLADSVTQQWELRDELTSEWPDAAPLLHTFAGRIEAFERSRVHAQHPTDSPETASVSECEHVLRALMDAVQRYDDGERQSRDDIERLLSRIDQLEKGVDVALGARGALGVASEESGTPVADHRPSSPPGAC
jgi:tRNA A-37 threonylcarbamoyl transferase component Bud32